MPITMTYAGVLGLLFFAMSVLVVRGRTTTRTNLGDGGNPQMLRLIRGHGNFSEYVPIVLVLLALLENYGAPKGVLHTVGGSAVLGRLAHGYAFFVAKSFPARVGGMILTFIALVTGAGACLYYGVAAL